MVQLPEHLIIFICVCAFSIDKKHLSLPPEWFFVFNDQRYWMELYERYYDIDQAKQKYLKPNWKFN